MKLNIHIGLFITILVAVLAAGWAASWWQAKMAAKNGKAGAATEGGTANAEQAAAASAVA